MGGSSSTRVRASWSRRFADGYGPASWEPAPGSAPAFEATSLRVAVTEQACASGEPAEGRVAERAIAYRDAVITIHFAVKTLPGDATCVPGPAAQVRIDLDEPVGERALLDGSVFPRSSAGRRLPGPYLTPIWGPTPAWAGPGSWLGRKDSNLRSPDPESGALPLGHSPVVARRAHRPGAWRIVAAWGRAGQTRV